ncbi:MAG: cupin domain-containing protein [Spongiibacteraceae bacterium]
MNKHDLIEQLTLSPHPEGGYFRRSYTATSGEAGRANASSIYYLLSDDSPIGHLHCNRSEILHCWQGGGSICYSLINSDGLLRQVILGPNIGAGEQLQLLVPGDVWKASELIAPSTANNFALVSELVVPEFVYAEHRMANYAVMRDTFPQQWPTLKKQIGHLIRPE